VTRWRPLAGMSGAGVLGACVRDRGRRFRSSTSLLAWRILGRGMRRGCELDEDFGHLIEHALGVSGSGWCTVGARVQFAYALDSARNPLRKLLLAIAAGVVNQSDGKSISSSAGQFSRWSSSSLAA
jgi:hypothetical protein